MLRLLNFDISPISPARMGANLRRLGWIAFWLQVILGFLPIVVLIMRVLSGRTVASTLFFGLCLAIICVIALLFSMYWSFHYVRLGRQLKNPDLRPSKKSVSNALWIGLIINLVGMVCAVLIAMSKIGMLTLNMLRLPVGATIIAPGAGGNLANQIPLISTSDMIVIQSLINTIAAELVGVIITVLLLSRTVQHLFSASEEYS